MTFILLSVTISCSDALNIIHRAKNVAGLTPIQETEIIEEIRKIVPFCPITIKKNDK